MRNPAPKLRYFNVEEVRANLIRQSNAAGLPTCFKQVIDLSLLTRWKWEYNGVSFRPDEQHPVLYAWIHDFMWIEGAGGYESDLIMRYLIERSAYGSKKALWYFRGVRLGWIFWYKWKHKRNKNIRPLTLEEIQCFNVAKKYYL